MRRAYLATALVCGVMAAMAACGGDDDSTPEAADAGNETSLVDKTPVVDTGSNVDTGIVDSGFDANDGSGTTLDGGSCGAGPVSVTSVVPQFAWVDGKTALTITGTGFIATPKIFLRFIGAIDGGVFDAGSDAGDAGDAGTGTGGYTQIAHVAFVSSTSLTAIIPANLVGVGTYELAVVNPNSCAGIVAGGIRIVPEAPPLVTEVSPASGTTQADVPVTIKGCNFAADAKVATVSSAGTVTAMTNAAPVCSGGNAPECNNQSPLCTMTATIETKTKGLASGAYVVRVTNTAQNTFGEYSTFVVTNPSGNLTGGWVAEDALVTGRRSLGLTAGRVNDASRFLYAVGGENAAGTALKTIDVGPLDRFGQLGKWFENKNQLGVARSGPAVTRFGKWVYVLGGTSAADGTKGAAPTGTPLESWERAKILDPANAPIVTDPPATSTASGTLAKGTWYYRVSAIGSDSEDPGGESIASDEVVATLSAAGNVTLTWQGIGGASGWKVYRSATPDATADSEVLLATINSGSTLQYVDDGSATIGTEKWMPLGSLGQFITTATAIGPRSNAAAVVARDPADASKANLYLSGGWGNCSIGQTTYAIVACVQVASINTSTGALGSFTTFGTLLNARMRHGSAVMTKENGPSAFTDGGAPASAAFLFVSGGRNAASSFGAATNVEDALIANGGGISGVFMNPGGYSTGRDGSQFAIANGYGYAFHGGDVNGANVNYNQQTSQAEAVVGTSSVTFPTWSNAAANLATKLGRHGVVDESAYFYLVGGTTNDTDALSTVYRVLH